MDMSQEEIAAAMGFSSFGSTKKRKYDQANSPKPKADSSGANTTRLGVRSKVSSDREDPGSQKHSSVQPGPTLYDNGREATKPTSAGENASAVQSQPNIYQKNYGARQDHASQSDMVSFPGRTISRYELRKLKSEGVADDQGHIAFFDPSFIEDPWARLT